MVLPVTVWTEQLELINEVRIVKQLADSRTSDERRSSASGVEYVPVIQQNGRQMNKRLIAVYVSLNFSSPC